MAKLGEARNEQEARMSKNSNGQELKRARTGTQTATNSLGGRTRAMNRTALDSGTGAAAAGLGLRPWHRIGWGVRRLLWTAEDLDLGNGA